MRNDSETKTPLAVLEHTLGIGDVVLTPAGRWRVREPIAGLEDLRALARRLDTYQLWLHPSWSLAHADVQLCQACLEPRDTAGRRRRHKHWLALELRACAGEGPGGVERCQLAIVQGDPNLRCLAGARDGGELLGLLARLERMLGTYWHGTAGATGVAILRESLRRRGLLEAELPGFVIRPEPDFGWQRPLSDAERSRKWLYCFDKHNMYLVASTTVGLGSGALEFKARPSFSARQPGYWHVRTSSWPSNHPLPDPTHGAGPPRAAAEYRWLSTPSVEAAIAAGIVEDIAAVYFWPRHGRYLQVLGNGLRRLLVTSSTAAARGDRSAQLTREALKAVYAELLGGYLARAELEGSGDPMFRPDWRDAIKAEARTRLWYSLRPLVQAGIPPIAVATDAIYVPSDADDADQVLAGLLVLGALPRQWALKSRVALAQVADCMVERVGYCRALVARVRALGRVR